MPATPNIVSTEPRIPDRSSGFGDSGYFAGPVHVRVASEIATQARRPISPIVNELYRTPPTRTDSDLAAAYATADYSDSTFTVLLPYLFYRPVPPTTNAVRARVFVKTWGAAAPTKFAVRLVSFNRLRTIPDGDFSFALPGAVTPSTYRQFSSAPSSITVDHDALGTTGQWIHTGSCRLAAPGGWTYLALAVSIADGAGASGFSFQIKALQIDGVIATDDVTPDSISGTLT